MKSISNKEYEEFQKYKTAKIKGQIITPEFLESLCESFNYDPYKLGKHLIECVLRQKAEESRLHF
jgi:hypothetical protein